MYQNYYLDLSKLPDKPRPLDGRSCVCVRHSSVCCISMREEQRVPASEHHRYAIHSLTLSFFKLFAMLTLLQVLLYYMMTYNVKNSQYLIMAKGLVSPNPYEMSYCIACAVFSDVLSLND